MEQRRGTGNVIGKIGEWDRKGEIENGNMKWEQERAAERGK